jgi:hypothetical protein
MSFIYVFNDSPNHNPTLKTSKLPCPTPNNKLYEFCNEHENMWIHVFVKVKTTLVVFNSIPICSHRFTIGSWNLVAPNVELM